MEIDETTERLSCGLSLWLEKIRRRIVELSTFYYPWSSISIIYVYGYTSYKQNVKHASLSDDSSHYCVSNCTFSYMGLKYSC